MGGRTSLEQLSAARTHLCIADVCSPSAASAGQELKLPGGGRYMCSAYENAVGQRALSQSGKKVTGGIGFLRQHQRTLMSPHPPSAPH